MSKAISKKDLKEPDTFFQVAARVGQFAEQNIKALVSVALAVVIALVGWFGFRAYQNSQELKASEALFPVEAKLLLALTPEAKEVPDLGEFLSTLKAHSSTKSALTSAMSVVGRLQAIEGSEAQQKEILGGVTYSPSKSSALFGLSRMTYGSVALENNELEEAKVVFKSILDEKSQSPFHAPALIQMGGIAEKGGDLGSARDFYTRVIQEFPDSEAKNIAEKLLIHLDLLSESPQQGS